MKFFNIQILFSLGGNGLTEGCFKKYTDKDREEKSFFHVVIVRIFYCLLVL